MSYPQFELPLEKDTIYQSSYYEKSGVAIYNSNVQDLYDTWDSPMVIISDGAYGLGLFPGDPHNVEELAAWYEPHVAKWTKKSTPQTTLWFWNSELGWATIHPLLVRYGWNFVNCHIWDKGIAHVAGNSNTKTLRKFPVVTEVCVQYTKEARVNGMTLRDWLRYEWARTGLPFSKTNEAAGVANAATRKYFTKDHLWYFPPPDAFAKITEYANRYGDPEGRPYFSANGEFPIPPEEWEKMRSKFTCPLGVTNVWRSPQLNGRERIKDGSKAVHRNQKPLHQIELIIKSSSDIGDLIWDPFGGIGTVPLAAFNLNRHCVSAEIQNDFYEFAVRRLHYAKQVQRSAIPNTAAKSGRTIKRVGTLQALEED